jgi:hypothetical protein
MNRIAALTIVRNSDRFLKRWISYYGAVFGRENLYVIFDGTDQKLPQESEGVTVHWFDHTPMKRAAGDRQRASWASGLAKKLLNTYDIVIGTDVDEFLLIDPSLDFSLSSYLLSIDLPPSLSALGMDVACNRNYEGVFDWDKPFLGQRQYCQISDRYTKACVLSRPLRWGSGFHRVKGTGFTIDPSLFLFHFGSVDEQVVLNNADDPEKKAMGWASHQVRRAAVADEISSVHDFLSDERIKTARRELSRPRSLLAWNKPRPLKSDKIVHIPKRFHGLV